MRRWTRSLLAGALLLTGCSNPPPPRTPPHVYTVMYGVVVSEPVGFSINYTGDGGDEKQAQGQPGRNWAALAHIEHDGTGYLMMRVIVQGPITRPDGSIGFPQVQCRIDVDGVLADSADEVDSIGCDVGVSFADLRKRSTATPQGTDFKP
jgi:hypothetical protein